MCDNDRYHLAQIQHTPGIDSAKLLLVAGLVVLIWVPFFIYPIFVMKVLCFALFACAFNLLLGYTGLLSFGHATFSAALPISPRMR